MLFVAPSETGLSAQPALRLDEVPLAFAFRKATRGRRRAEAALQPSRTVRRRVASAAAGRERRAQPARPLESRAASSRPARASGVGRSDRSSPTRGTSSKRPTAATSICAGTARRRQAFHLLGLVRDARATQRGRDLLPQGAVSRSRPPRDAHPPRAADGKAGSTRKRRCCATARGDWRASEGAEVNMTRPSRLLEHDRRARRRIVPGAGASTCTAATVRCTPAAQRCSIATPRPTTRRRGRRISPSRKLAERASTRSRSSSFASAPSGWRCRRRWSPKSPARCRSTRCRTGAASIARPGERARRACCLCVARPHARPGAMRRSRTARPAERPSAAAGDSPRRRPRRLSRR